MGGKETEVGIKIMGQIPLARVLSKNELTAMLVMNPRKERQCAECGLIIEVSEPHYTITYRGAGLESIKFPDRVCVSCVRKKLNIKTYYEGRYTEWQSLYVWSCDHRAELEASGRMRGVTSCLQKLCQELLTEALSGTRKAQGGSLWVS